jgi:hypothetical protein
MEYWLSITLGDSATMLQDTIGSKHQCSLDEARILETMCWDITMSRKIQEEQNNGNGVLRKVVL